MLNKKILFVASASFWGGATVALFNMVSYLAKNFDVRVVVPSYGMLCEKLDQEGIQYYVVPCSLSIWPPRTEFIKFPYRIIKMMIVNWRAQKALEEIIQEYKPHLVHNNVGPLDISFSVCKKYNIPHVWHIREYQDLDFNIRFFPRKKIFEKKIKAEGNYNIAITKGIFNYWRLRDGVDAVIYDGVINGKESNRIETQKKIDDYYLFVGRVEPAKGLMMVLRAFCRFVKDFPDEKLLVAGSCTADKKYYQECVMFVYENFLEKNVFFLGERRDVYSLMSKANALVVASRFEGFGFITAEAMYNYCLVIGRNTAGTKEQFDVCLDETGIDVGIRFDNEEELVSSLVKVKENKMAQEKKLGHYVVERNYTTEVCGKKILDFYEKIWKENEISN